MASLLKRHFVKILQKISTKYALITSGNIMDSPGESKEIFPVEQIALFHQITQLCVN